MHPIFVCSFVQVLIDFFFPPLVDNFKEILTVEDPAGQLAPGGDAVVLSMWDN